MTKPNAKRKSGSFSLLPGFKVSGNEGPENSAGRKLLAQNDRAIQLVKQNHKPRLLTVLRNITEHNE